MKIRSTLLLVLLAVASAIPVRGKPPNFVFILVDDLGQRDLGCYGSTFYETPRLDQLAVSGMRFTDAYAACPVCSPTRASLMTGKFAVRTGITDYIGGNRHLPGKWNKNTLLIPAPYADRLALEETTLAEALHEGGYSTFFAGKWHLGPQGCWPEDQGFDVNLGGCEAGMPASWFDPYKNPRIKDETPGEYLPERLTRETIRFIEEHREEPFLVFLSYYLVHTPLKAPEPLVDKYKAKQAKLPASRLQFAVESNGTKARLQQNHPVYAAMVEALDTSVGKVLNALETQGLADNTVVIFTSDNGGLSTAEGRSTSNYPLRTGKGWLYEGGIRVPLIVHWPGVTKPGSECAEPVVSTDYYPTLLEMANLPARPKQHVDGESIVPLLQGELRERGPIYWHYPHYSNQFAPPGGAIREGDWKLIEWYETGELELFNLADDIGEQHNLAATEASRSAQMLRKLQQWREQTGAVMPTQNPNFR